MRHASLIQSALGKHHAREIAHTGKEVSDDRRLLILKILLILEILLQATEPWVGTSVCSQLPVARLQTAPTGDLL
ncbi:hypothetical protein C6495_17280 [Candidatus Poribacteria bacterium]|nr:MAG: hypothetical protein C6495_17280 [Candidatus Poribacteria bacterium]